MNTKRNRLVGCIVGIGGGFIGVNHYASARSIISPRVDIDACVPGRPEAFEVNKAVALEFGFDEDRIYPDVPTMLESEQGKSQFIIIATPNHLHATQAIMAMKAGYDVVLAPPRSASL